MVILRTLQSLGMPNEWHEGENIYRDAAGLQYTQMGADVLNPMNAPRSQFMQNTPIGLKNNANAPYNLQPQPPAEAADQMAGMNYAMEAQKRGLYNQFMGLTGLTGRSSSTRCYARPRYNCSNDV